MECISTGGDTTLTYYNGTSTVALGTGTAGTVNDLPGPPGAVGFFAFATAPALHFTLLLIGPGVSTQPVLVCRRVNRAPCFRVLRLS